jgi:hypothetical protein
LIKNKPFGDKIAKNFNIGDLVFWTSWAQDENRKIVTKTHYGVLVNIVHNGIGGREVVYARVLPINSKETIELNINKIRKKETN